MRNLKLISHNIVSVEIENDTKICIDPISRSLFAANVDGIFQLRPQQLPEGICNFPPQIWKEVNITLSKVVAVEVITSLNSTCVISKEGDVITVNIENQLVEIAGSVTDGISAACWSPDQELLALVTEAFSVILMTADFEPIVEFPLEQDNFGENNFINIGWGKKETQFHGSAGKQAAKEIKPTIVPSFEWDDRMPKISWRGDGQLFAISYVYSSTKGRKFRVINRAGDTQYTSENVEGLEDSFHWKPSGNLIASSQRLSNKHNIVFFEKNGLQHGSFTLPLNCMDMKVQKVLWNQDSSILLVWLEPLQSDNNNNNETLIQLWRVGNYHWYLKEEIPFNEHIYDVNWDQDQPFLLNILTSSNLHILQFILSTDKSRGESLADIAQVAVIDGKKLLITPFRQAVVPPPLSAYEITFCDQIHSVIYAPPLCSKNSPDTSVSVEDSGFLEVFDPPGSNSNNICVYNGKDTLTFLTLANHNEQLSDLGCEVTVSGVGGKGFSVNTKVHRVFSQHKIEAKIFNEHDKKMPGMFYNWLWISENTIAACCISKSKNYVIIFDLEGLGTETGRIIGRNAIFIEDEIISLASSSDGSLICLQSIKGDLFKLCLVDSTITPWIENGVQLKFPTVCDEVLVCSVSPSNQYVPLGLSCRNRLYLGNIQLLSDCTSFHLHTDHLLLTTTSHNLMVVPRSFNALKSLSDGVNKEFSEIGVRRTERGSRLVTAVQCDTRVLLQMPRGNLEMVSPRPVTVHTLKRLLSEHSYHLAVDIMRRQRIDMNLIYDHDPKDFLSHIEDFVNSVGNPQWIDLFIANLNDSDVTLAAYSSSYNRAVNSDVGPKNTTNKIDLVSEALKKTMTSIDEEKYLLPILTTFVKSSKNEMHLALQKLKIMKNTDTVFKVSYEEGLRHLLYVSDANELCDVALGTYDFELVLLVFEKSQKDPKEYLPFLNNLKELEENYCHFKINVHLKRYKTALECFRNCDETHNDECMTLIKKEKLFNDAIEIFSKNSPFYLTICNAYADYLQTKGYDNEAAIMYTRGQNLESALKSYEQGNNWREVLITSSNLNYTKEQLRDLCNSLVEKLKEKNCYYDAATIYEKYMQSEEDAVECLVQANQWEEALLLANKYQRFDLVETNIKPGILGQFDNLDAEIQRITSSFNKYFERLVLVRLKKQEDYIDYLEGKDECQLDSDLYSDSSTVTGFLHLRSNMSSSRTNATSASGRSYRSSKNKRKLDRKKYSTKEGSNYEDLGLVVELRELMVAANEITSAVSDLNRILLIFGEDAKAKSLQNNLDNIIQYMLKKKLEVWPNCFPVEEEIVEFGPQMTTESAVKQMKSGESQREKNFIFQRMNELEPHLRFPPHLEKVSGWKLFSLR